MRCAVLGDPISHSLSPTLHRAGYAAVGLDWQYDAIRVTTEEFPAFVLGRGPEWRGLSLTMPHKRNAMAFTHGRVTDRARLEEVMVYSIGLENEYFNGSQRVRSSPDRNLRKLSEETGGGFFLLKKKDELGPTFTRVAQELHSQYVLGFSPEVLDGKVHKLEVRLKRPGLTPRARKSYVAGSAAPTTQK